jgi:hypothetical protein
MRLQAFLELCAESSLAREKGTPHAAQSFARTPASAFSSVYVKTSLSASKSPSTLKSKSAVPTPGSATRPRSALATSLRNASPLSELGPALRVSQRATEAKSRNVSPQSRRKLDFAWQAEAEAEFDGKVDASQPLSRRQRELLTDFEAFLGSDQASEKGPGHGQGRGEEVYEEEDSYEAYGEEGNEDEGEEEEGDEEDAEEQLALMEREEEERSRWQRLLSSPPIQAHRVYPGAAPSAMSARQTQQPGYRIEDVQQEELEGTLARTQYPVELNSETETDMDVSREDMEAALSSANNTVSTSTGRTDWESYATQVAANTIANKIILTASTRHHSPPPPLLSPPS